MKITIDTCLINVREKNSTLNELEQLHKKGSIEIIGTERLTQETESNTKRKEKASTYKNISEPQAIGFGAIGKSYISKDNTIKLKDISSILFPNKDINELSNNESCDVMHLISHSQSDSDYFVTNNTKDFINARKNNENRNGSYKNVKRNQLGKLGINVCTPEEVLEIIKQRNK